MGELNVELMERVMDRILTDPDSWTQDGYCIIGDCGTTFCFAGHAIMLAGGEINEYGAFFFNGERISPDVKAQDLLGLDTREAHRIFDTFTKNPDYLHRTVKDVINNHQSTPTP